MKYLIIVLLVCFLIIPSYAQPQTLISGKIENSGYGGVIMSYGPIKNQSGILMGGEGAWLVNRTFFLGGAGCSLVSDLKASSFDPTKTGDLTLSWGGIKTGIVLRSDALTHFVVSALLGFGTVGYKQASGNISDQSNITVIEPKIEYEVNIASFFRAALGLSYRLVSGASSTSGLTNSDLSGYLIGICLKWGYFGGERP